MINLAALRYRDVLAADGGPIERLSCGETSVLGARWFEANAYLRSEHAPGRYARHVYGAADGTGTDRSPMLARFKAVSEAIERWAQMSTLAGGEGGRYGFDVDPSSNGMAAYPGLWHRQARWSALMEAAERFNLMNWWEGRLEARTVAAPWPGLGAAVIESEAPGVTVLLWRKSPRGYTAYGHAAARNFVKACERAVVELERHDLVIRYYALTHTAAERSGRTESELHTSERRCLFFAFEEGSALFEERLAGSRTSRGKARPQIVFDGVIRGPWEHYATVWRVLYAPPSDRFLAPDLGYFFW